MKNWIRRALGAAMALTLTAGLLSGCGSAEDPVQEVMGYPGSTVMFTVNGSDVTAEEYLFWLAQYTDQASAYLTSMGNVEGDQSIWDMDFYNGTTAGESVKQAAQQNAILYNVVTAHGEEGGYTYTDEDKADFHMLYEDSLPLEDKIRKIAKEIYGALGVTIAPAAKKELANITEMGYGNLPVCIAKTQYSFSDNAKLTGAPTGFTMEVREVRLAAGAGFVVVICGNIMTMPGLPKKPAAVNIDVDADGKITGLF